MCRNSSDGLVGFGVLDEVMIRRPGGGGQQRVYILK